MQRIAIYVRKSAESEDRQVLSIDSQTKELKDYAASRGWTIREIMTESKSAKSPGRPVFGKLVESIQSGQIDAILCWKLDRLARNPVDGGAIIWALDEQKLRYILTPQREFANTGNDKFWLQLEFGMAKKYVDDLSDNVKRGMRAKLERGWLPQCAPVGYLNDRNNKTIIKDPDRFPIVKRMWNHMLTGKYTVTEIHHRATDDWGLRNPVKDNSDGKKIALSAIFSLFRNPFYCGVIRYNGQYYDGAHPKMISRAQFEAVQQLLDRRHTSKPHRHNFTYSGLMTCGECGAAITVENKKNRYGYRYIYYRCTHHKPGVPCRQRSIEEKQLEKDLLSFVRSISLPLSFLSWALSALDEIESENKEQSGQRLAMLKRKKEICSSQIDELLTLRLQKIITDEQYLERQIKIEQKEASLVRQIANDKTALLPMRERFEKVISLATKMPEIYQTQDKSRKRALIRSVCSDLQIRDKKLLTTAREPFALIQFTVKTAEAQNAMFAPRVFGELQQKEKGSNEPFLLWWGLVKYVRTFLIENPDFFAKVGPFELQDTPKKGFCKD